MEEFELTDGEIDGIVEPLHEDLHYPWNPEEHEAVAKEAQKKLVGWLDDYLYGNKDGNWILYDDDWQRLQKAVGK